jgi:hypothetical protein
MRLLALTVATTTMLSFAFPLTPQVLAQGADDGAVGRPLQLDGGPSVGSDNHGSSVGSDNHGQIGSRSQATEPSDSSKKSQTAVEKTGEAAVGRRSKTHVGWRRRPLHRFAIRRHRYHVFAFHSPRHPFVIHRHGRRFVAVNDSVGV